MAFSEFDILPISYLRQHLFCSRIPWFKHVMNFEPPEQQWVLHGRKWHESQNPRNKRRVCRLIDEPLTKKTEVYVKSMVLGIHGYIDELILNNHECIVIEYKVDTAKPNLAQQVQLLGYAIAAEEFLGLKVKGGILLKGSAIKQYSINLNRQLKQQLLLTLGAMRENISSHRIPKTSAQSAKCDQCEYLRYCNDR